MLGLRQRSSTSGYTLLELMVTLAIVAILASVAVPSFTDFVRSQRLRSVAVDLNSSLQLARSEAVKRNTNVTVARGGSSWVDGWTVAVGGTTLRSQGAVSGVNITGSANSFNFRSNGRIDNTVNFALVSDGNASLAKCLRVSLSGSSVVDDGGC
ncbi:GspH/FimT family pseudopilin [Spongiibacter taiwanensis]|uniref:GspH/FimT family pseudopilin n=1 Tax=Spongiibacter taiwanensis TaxID=1748242 RepID=UPI0020351DC0|nr:GspH/FimT family pseudopilin [Spongiibacter taiwanensis]USA44195.1 GspH/FimT family pseudopilin [Spongiibacter taiwanensis]